MIQVRVDHWREGLNKVELNHLLRERAGLGLAEAKRTVDDLVPGNGFVCTFHDMMAASAFTIEAGYLGATCSRLWIWRLISSITLDQRSRQLA